MKITTVLLIILLTIQFKSYSQPYPKKDILKKMKAKDLVWRSYNGDDMVLAKMKNTKKWGMYTVYIEMGAEDFELDEFDEVVTPKLDIDSFKFDELIPPKFDSLSFFIPESKFQIVKQKKKYGILLLPSEVPDAVKRVKCQYDKLIHKQVDEEDYILFQEDGKWGLIDWFDEFVIIDPVFDTPDEVPLVEMENWMIETFKTAKKSLDADLIIFDPYNGDGVLKARHRKSKKWGMYQFIENEQQQIIPMQYDSLDFFRSNGKFTAVYNNGKVGFYLSNWSYYEEAKQTVACKYEDYKRFNVDRVSKLAVKKNGKWGWINWLTGEEKSEFKYEIPDDLPFPDFKQNYWFDE